MPLIYDHKRPLNYIDLCRSRGRSRHLKKVGGGGSTNNFGFQERGWWFHPQNTLFYLFLKQNFLTPPPKKGGGGTLNPLSHWIRHCVVQYLRVSNGSVSILSRSVPYLSLQRLTVHVHTPENGNDVINISYHNDDHYSTVCRV